MLLRFTKNAFPILALSLSVSANAASVEAGQFQAYLHQQIDSEGPYAIIPLYPSEQTKKLAHTVLDKLWQDSAYRDNMHAWLEKNQADVMEDLLASWRKHYQKAFVSSLDFVDDDSLSLLWRMSGPNAIYAMKRENCQTYSPAQLEIFVTEERQRLLNDNADKLGISLPKAMHNEFLRLNTPRPGDRPVDTLIAKIATRSLHAIALQWPEVDAKRIIERFSYGAKQASPQEYCEMLWVVSHAINDSKLDNSKEQVSSLLLRVSATGAGYTKDFERANTAGRAKPAIEGFKPGNAFVYYPGLVMTNKAKGTVNYVISVDDTGQVSDVSVAYGTVTPATLKSIDGSIHKTDTLLLKVIDAYFRAGSFAPKVQDGKAVAYKVSVPFAWRAE